MSENDSSFINAIRRPSKPPSPQKMNQIFSDMNNGLIQALQTQKMSYECLQHKTTELNKMKVMLHRKIEETESLVKQEKKKQMKRLQEASLETEVNQIRNQPLFDKKSLEHLKMYLAQLRAETNEIGFQFNNECEEFKKQMKIQKSIASKIVLKMNNYKIDGVKECLNIVSGKNKAQLLISDNSQSNRDIQNFLDKNKYIEQKSEVTLSFSNFLTKWFVENASLLK